MPTHLRPLSAGELLDLWEWGQSQTPARRALGLLSAASPQIPTETLSGLSIGRRDALLFTLRQLLFGQRLEAVAACAQCGERMEMSFAVSDVSLGLSDEAVTLPALEIPGWRIVYRLPDSSDLLFIEDTPVPKEARARLLDRCLLAAEQEGQPVAARDLPTEIIAALAARMAEADPQASIQLNLNCWNCGYSWSPVFDIAAFLWEEIQSWALRTLLEIHTLASAYGWSESEILALSPWRRQAYLGIVSA